MYSHTFPCLWSFFVWHSVGFWLAQLWNLAASLILTCSFLWWGSIKMKIEFMLISSHHFDFAIFWQIKFEIRNRTNYLWDRAERATQRMSWQERRDAPPPGGSCQVPISPPHPQASLGCQDWGVTDGKRCCDVKKVRIKPFRGHFSKIPANPELSNLDERCDHSGVTKALDEYKSNGTVCIITEESSFSCKWNLKVTDHSNESSWWVLYM